MSSLQDVRTCYIFFTSIIVAGFRVPHFPSFPPLPPPSPPPPPRVKRAAVSHGKQQLLSIFLHEHGIDTVAWIHQVS